MDAQLRQLNWGIDRGQDCYIDVHSVYTDCSHTILSATPDLKSKVIIIAGAVAVAAAIFTVAVMVFASFSGINGDSPPNVKFVQFDTDRQEILVGENMKVFFNVESHEPRTINDTKVIMLIEPSSGEAYLSVDKPTVILPILHGKESRTGEVQASITATGSPAKEAVFVVKGVLYVEGHQTDVREFDLKVRQQQLSLPIKTILTFFT